MQNYDYIGKESEGLRRVKVGIYPNYKCGFIDDNNKLVIPLLYANARDFREGMAAVRIGNWASDNWGFINKEGELVIPIKYKYPRYFSDGLVKVILDNEWCFINKIGEKVISLNKYDGGGNFHKGFAVVIRFDKNNRKEIRGMINKSGIEVIPCK